MRFRARLRGAVRTTERSAIYLLRQPLNLADGLGYRSGQGRLETTRVVERDNYAVTLGGHCDMRYVSDAATAP